MGYPQKDTAIRLVSVKTCQDPVAGEEARRDHGCLGAPRGSTVIPFVPVAPAKGSTYVSRHPWFPEMLQAKSRDLMMGAGLVFSGPRTAFPEIGPRGLL